jgi:hypothetical protein
MVVGSDVGWPALTVTTPSDLTGAVSGLGAVCAWQTAAAANAMGVMPRKALTMRFKGVAPGGRAPDGARH